MIYIALGTLPEIFIHPITILWGFPATALLTLMLFHHGIVVQIGNFRKNAIIMIDFGLEQQRNSNATVEKAIFKACLLRIRPIMVTAIAAIISSLRLSSALARARNQGSRWSSW